MPARGTRQCHNCGRFKPLAEFFARDIALGMCTQCALWRVDVPDRALRRYGLTAIDYVAMLLDQNDRCAVCQKVRPLHVDHCHVTGRVRGLVCVVCNTAMGMLGDDADRLQRAADHITYGGLV
jgi:hypothetical protein